MTDVAADVNTPLKEEEDGYSPSSAPIATDIASTSDPASTPESLLAPAGNGILHGESEGSQASLHTTKASTTVVESEEEPKVEEADKESQMAVTPSEENYEVQTERPEATEDVGPSSATVGAAAETSPDAGAMKASNTGRIHRNHQGSQALPPLPLASYPQSTPMGRRNTHGVTSPSPKRKNSGVTSPPASPKTPRTKSGSPRTPRTPRTARAKSSPKAREVEDKDGKKKKKKERDPEKVKGKKPGKGEKGSEGALTAQSSETVSGVAAMEAPIEVCGIPKEQGVRCAEGTNEAAGGITEAVEEKAMDPAEAPGGATDGVLGTEQQAAKKVPPPRPTTKPPLRHKTRSRRDVKASLLNPKEPDTGSTGESAPSETLRKTRTNSVGSLDLSKISHDPMEPPQATAEEATLAGEEDSFEYEEPLNKRSNSPPTPKVSKTAKRKQAPKLVTDWRCLTKDVSNAEKINVFTQAAPRLLPKSVAVATAPSSPRSPRATVSFVPTSTASTPIPSGFVRGISSSAPDRGFAYVPSPRLLLPFFLPLASSLCLFSLKLRPLMFV